MFSDDTARLTRVLLTLLATSYITLVLVGCDDDPVSSDPDETADEVILAEETVVIDPGDMPLTEIGDGELVFSLTGDSPDIASNDVIVGEEGGGFLRRVTDTEVDQDRITVTTEQASLVEAVEQGSIDESFDLSDSQLEDAHSWTAKQTLEGVKPKSDRLGVELDGVGVFFTSDVNVTFSNGQIDYSPEVDLDISIRSGEIDRFRLASVGTVEFSTDFEVEARVGVAVSNDVTLATFTRPPKIIFIGKLPVTIHPELKFIAGCEVGIDEGGTMSSGLEVANTVTLGAEYNGSNWSPISERETELGFREFEWEKSVSGEVKCYVRPELSFKVYQVAGPFVNASPYSRIGVEVGERSWEWGVYTGLDAGLGGSVEIFDFGLARYEHTFDLVETEIAGDTGESGENEVIITGAVTDEETGEGVEGAAVTGVNPDTNNALFQSETNGLGEYEAAFAVDSNPDDIIVEATAENYSAASETIPFEEEMSASITLIPEDSDTPPDGSDYSEDFADDPNYVVATSSTDSGSELEWDQEQENYFVRAIDGSGAGEWWAFAGTPLFAEFSDNDSFSVSFDFNPVQPDWGSYPGLRFARDENEGVDGGEADVKWAFRLDCRDSIECSRSTEETNSRFRLGLGGQDDPFLSPRLPAIDEWYSVDITYDGSQSAAEIVVLREDGSVFVEESGLPLMGMNTRFNRVLIGQRSGGPPEYGNESIIRVDNIATTRD